MSSLSLHFPLPSGGWTSAQGTLNSLDICLFAKLSLPLYKPLQVRGDLRPSHSLSHQHYLVWCWAHMCFVLFSRSDVCNALSSAALLSSHRLVPMASFMKPIHLIFGRPFPPPLPPSPCCLSFSKKHSGCLINI